MTHGGSCWRRYRVGHICRGRCRVASSGAQACGPAVAEGERWAVLAGAGLVVGSDVGRAPRRGRAGLSGGCTRRVPTGPAVRRLGAFDATVGRLDREAEDTQRPTLEAAPATSGRGRPSRCGRADQRAPAPGGCSTPPARRPPWPRTSARRSVPDRVHTEEPRHTWRAPGHWFDRQARPASTASAAVDPLFTRKFFRPSLSGCGEPVGEVLEGLP
jgi:hypothetical protein